MAAKTLMQVNPRTIFAQDDGFGEQERRFLIDLHHVPSAPGSGSDGKILFNVG
jgi:hypothetical protein